MKRHDRKLAGFFRLNWLLLCIAIITITSIIFFFRNSSAKPPKIKTSKTSGFVYEAKNQNFSAQIGVNKSPNPFVSFTSKAGGNVAFQMVGDLNTSIEEKDNKITFKNVNSNTDVSYTPLPNGIKEEITINQSTSRAEYTFDILTVNASPRKTLEGNYSGFFFNDEGLYQFHLEKPYAIDASGQRTEDISMKIRKSEDADNKYQIQLILSEEWLKSRDRSYPIVIDPTIIYDSSSEFAVGQLNRIKDTGSGSSPSLETYYQSWQTDPHTAGLWHMDEASGNLTDSSGNSNTGTATGTTVVTGILNNARSFNGTTDRFAIADSNSLDTGGTFTIEAWVYPTSLASRHTIFSTRFANTAGSWQLEVGTGNGGTGRASITGVGIWIFDSVDNVIETNKWTHIAYSRISNSDTGTMYINGRQVASSATTAYTVIDNTAVKNIGVGTSSTQFFTGTIDEVRLSNVARSAEEIKVTASRRPYGIYTSDILDFNTVATWNPLIWSSSGVTTGDGETLKDATSLIAQWNFNETSGTTATNNAGSCGSACNGTLQNFLLTSSQDQEITSSATGGSISHAEGYTIHTFTSSGTFTPSSDMTVDVLVVAGGGGGGNTGSGGGAGGYVYSTNFAVSAQAYPVTVGAGGLGGATTAAPGAKGNNSVFSSITAEGGGAGFSHGGSAGGNGGSGGGGTIATTGSASSGGTGSQGSAGGAGFVNASWLGTNGGGGGAGGAGGAGGSTGGAGGVGLANSISGTSVTYAGGGGGGEVSGSAAGAGGAGGGGSAVLNAAGNSGTPNTGGGGAGGSYNAGVYTNGGNGGSGVVIIRYASSQSGWTAANRRWGAGALMFDGADDYVTVPNTSALNPTTISLEAWYKPNSFVDNHNIIDKRDAANSAVNYLLQVIPTTGLVQFASRPTKFDLFSSSPVEIGKWNHIVATFDGTTARIYINGILSNSASYTGTLSVTSDNSLKICRMGTISDYYCNGVLDSTRIYSRALTPTEIISNYQAGNLELQTRVGDTTNPNDGTWEEWRPLDVESVIESFDDNSSLIVPSSDVYPGALISTSTTSIPSIDGINGLKIQTGQNTSLTNVVGLWHMDETSGTDAYIKDSSANANHGTPSSATLSEGISNKSRTFTASSNYITTPSTNLGFTNAITAEAWVYPTGTDSSWNWIVSQWPNPNGVNAVFNLSYSTAYKLHFNVQNCSVSLHSLTGNTPLRLNSWNHVAASYNGSTGSIALYVNGNLDNTSNGTAGTICNTSLPITFGKSPFDNIQSLKGRIDEVRLSNVVRSPEEIFENYRMGRDHYVSKTLSSVNLSNKRSLPFYVAADRRGTYLAATIGESAYVNNQTDENTIAKWSFDEDSGAYPKSCYVLRLSGVTTDGVYTIDPDGPGGSSPLQVYCNMTYDGGGWTMMVKSWYGSGMIGNANAVGAVTDAITLKGNPYKLADTVIRNIIGPSKNFDVMADQNGRNTSYSAGNYEFVVIRNYTGDFTYERAVPASTTTTTFQSYRISDQALAWTGNIICGYDASTGVAGINCLGSLGVTNNPQGGAGCTINMGTSSNAGWYHFFMNQYNDDTYLYICNGAQHSSSMNFNHRFWVRERFPVTGTIKDSADKGEPSSQITATGGTVTTVNGYKIHTFTSSGTFQVTSGTGSVEVLAVAGGGGGGMNMGGGGGGGGLVSNSAYAVSPQSYTVTVGAGGSGAPAASTNGQPAAHPFTIPATSGQNTVFGTITAIGGGFGGGSPNNMTPGPNGAAGGSGGGASGYNNTGVAVGTITGGAGTANQGFRGGNQGVAYYSGGGGGASEAGGDGNNRADGGTGVTSDISGTSLFWSGGGGGSGYTVCGGHGGQGGGGGGAVCATRGGSGTNPGSSGGGGVVSAQTNKPGGNAGANTGGGGGGGSHYNATNKGGDGGSGVVIVRYPVSVTDNSTVYGATTTTGKIGLAKSFNGTSNYISLGDRDLFDDRSNFTFDAWVYPTIQTATTHARVYSEQNVVYLGQYGNQVSFYMGDGTAWQVLEYGGGTLALNKWNHVAWVKSGTAYRIYVNGQLTKSGSAPATLGSSSGTNYIGSYNGIIQNWPGKLDELRLSDNVRTTEQIRQVFEMEKRTHTVTVDFTDQLNVANLISDSSDLSFRISTSPDIYNGEKVVVKENVSGTDYIAQGLVSGASVQGNVNVTSWDTGSTFPPGGFTVNATVFKWQREYWNINNEVLDSDIDAITNITFRVTDGNEARNIWIDDFRSSGGYLSNSAGATIQSSTGKRYAQYRAIYSSFDEAISSSLYSVNMSAVSTKPEQPTGLSGTAVSPTSIRWDFTDNSDNEDGNRLYDSTGNSLLVTNSNPNTTSITETGLTPNTPYARKVVGYNTFGESPLSSMAIEYTLANTPSSPNVTRALTSASIFLNLNSNPSTTYYAVYKETGNSCDGVGGNYITQAGAENGSTAIWLPQAVWMAGGSITVPNLDAETIYSFCAKARNDEGFETNFSSSAIISGELVPMSGDLTIQTQNSTNLLSRYKDGGNPNRFIVGLDTVGAGNANSSQLNLNGGSLTLNSDETLVVGKIVLGGGSLFIANGATVAPGAKLWAIDRDQDGYPDKLGGEVKLWYGLSANPTSTISASYFRRKGLLSTLKTSDCDDNSYSSSNICCSNFNYYVDADGDGFGIGSVVPICRITQSPAPEGYSLNNTDCNDTGTNANLVSISNTCYVDADGDTYGAGTAQTCTNHASCTSATRYSLGDGTAVSSAVTAGTLRTTNTDCGPNTATAYPGSATCGTASFLNASGVASYDYNCSVGGGAGTLCGASYYGVISHAYCDFACGKDNGTCCHTQNVTVINAAASPQACGVAGYLRSGTAYGHSNCGGPCNPVPSGYNLGAAGVQGCN